MTDVQWILVYIVCTRGMCVPRPTALRIHAPHQVGRSGDPWWEYGVPDLCPRCWYVLCPPASYRPVARTDRRYDQRSAFSALRVYALSGKNGKWALVTFLLSVSPCLIALVSALSYGWSQAYISNCPQIGRLPMGHISDRPFDRLSPPVQSPVSGPSDVSRR